jgi:hypothetical protein
MDNEIMSKFQKLGARAKITVLPNQSHMRTLYRYGYPIHRPIHSISIDIRRDDAGEFFDLRRRNDIKIRVLDLRPEDRHLLLMAREIGAQNTQIKSKFLCGHDERSWFVAAIPEAAPVSSVQNAKDALKPREVWEAVSALGVCGKDRDRRRNVAFVRQGEWFFIPLPRMRVDEKFVLRNEPIRRGAGKPHGCQFVFRTGGEPVWVCSAFPNGLRESEYRALSQTDRDRHAWRQMVRDALVYAKGWIRHPDHRTVWLQCWHQVVMNTETRSRAMQHVAFLD